MKNGERLLGINPKEEDWQFLSGHVIDGEFPEGVFGFLNHYQLYLSFLLFFCR